MKNNLENPEILGTNIYAAMRMILRAKPNAVFGGSIVFCAMNLIARKIHDIDVLVLKDNASDPNDALFALLKKENHVADAQAISLPAEVRFNDRLMNINQGAQVSDEPSGDVTDINGKLIERVHGTLLGVNVCVFLVGTLNYSEFPLYDLSIRLQIVNDALLAKMAYAKIPATNQQKHVADVQAIQQKFDEIF